MNAEILAQNDSSPHMLGKIKALSISKNALCWIYGIVPLCLIIMIVDRLFLNNAIRNVLPLMPESLFIYSVIFNAPHIVASTFSFWDKEYLVYYKNKLLVPSFIIILTVCVPPWIFGATGFYFVFLILFLWTVEHVIGQQFGLTRMMTRPDSRSFSIWRWSGLFIGIGLYTGVYANVFGYGKLVDSYVKAASFALLIPFIFSTWAIHKQCNDVSGTRYLWLNFATILSAFLAYLVGYPFFVIFIPRFIHDVTAFTFYIVHDQNRNAYAANNLLYRPFRRICIPIAFLCPFLAMAFLFPLTYVEFGGGSWAFFQHAGISLTFIKNAYYAIYDIAIVTAFLHYYTDSFVWKQGSIHRRYISIT